MPTINSFIWEAQFKGGRTALVTTMANNRDDAKDAALKLREGTEEKGIVSIDFIKELVIVI